jgi:PAS domain S-box-containing protein
MIGWEPSEMIGQLMHDVLHHSKPDGAAYPLDECPIYATLADGAVHRIDEEVFWRKDGTSFPVDYTSTPIRDKSGRLLGALVTFRDITRRKQSENALRDSERRYRSLVEAARDVIVTLSAEGRITSLNPAFEAVTGWSRDEWLGQSFEPLVHPQDLPMVLQMFQQTLIGKLNPAYEARIRSRSDKYLVGEITATPQIEAGRVVGALAFVRDVTRRKELEEQLAQTQRMELIGRFAGGIAHDFNNLLTAIIGFSELVMSDLSPDSALRPDLEEIKKTGERASALTKQLLAFSRKQVLQPRLLYLNDVVQKMLGLLQGSEAENIALTTRLSAVLGWIKIDPVQIEQVILNLVVNARDAMPEGGTITLVTDNVNLDGAHAQEHIGARPGAYVMLQVIDTGLGIDAYIRPHIFEPFFTTKKGKGTGLGLATVLGIVQQSGGHITVSSERGKGSTFSVYFPRVNEAVAPVKPRPAFTEVLEGTETILLVDEEKAIRELARRTLKTKGYAVLEASNGLHALAICDRNDSIDLVITELVMPDMNGLQLADRLKAMRPEKKVLYMSGYIDSSVAEDGILGENAAFLSKPFTALDLARKVREVLDG